MSFFRSASAIALLVALSGPLTARADAARCQAFIDFLRQSYAIVDLSCADLATVRAFQLGNPGVRKMPLKGRVYAVELLTGLNTNRFVCGRDREIMKYTGAFGETKTTDIATDHFIKQNLVQPDLLLPIPPDSLLGAESLTNLFGRYLDASENPSSDPKETLYGMAQAREAFWSEGMRAMMKDEGCAPAFCAAFGTAGEGDKSCAKTIAKLGPSAFLEKMTVPAKRPAVEAASVSAAEKPPVRGTAGGAAAGSPPAVPANDARPAQ